MPTLFNHEALRSARLELELTQAQAAEALKVDIRTYRRYESGEVNDPTEGFAVRNQSRRKLLRRIHDELGVEEDALLIQPKSFWAHPLARARHFVGREEEQAKLRSALKKPGVIAVTGMGGAGKTAMVERCLAEHPPAQTLLVWSFYEDPRAESFLEFAARSLIDEEVPIGARVSSLSERLSDGQPRCLILDGLELMQSDGSDGRALGELLEPALRRVLLLLAQAKGASRAVITSRFALADLGAYEGEGLTTLALEPLPLESARALLRQWGLKDEPAALRRLWEHAGGHALSIAVLGSYIGGFLDGAPERLDEVPLHELAQDDALARRLGTVLSTYTNALSEAERAFLARISVLGARASIDAIERLAQQREVAGALQGATASRLNRIARRLSKLGLLNLEQGACSVHPFLQSHFRSLLDVSTEKVHATLRGEARVGLDSLRARPRAAPVSPELLDAYETLLVHTLFAGNASGAHAIYQRSMGGFEHLGLVLGDMHRGARLTALLGEAELPALARAELKYERGLFAASLGDLHTARCVYREHLKLVEDQRELSLTAMALRTMAYTERLAGRLDEALSLIERSLSEAAIIQSSGHKIRAIALKGAIHHDRGEMTQARNCFDALSTLGDRPVARRALWRDEHLLESGATELAEQGAQQNLQQCQQLSWDGHAAQCHLLLGRIAAQRGEDAREHLRAALEWTDRTGEVEMVLAAQTLRATIEPESEWAWVIAEQAQRTARLLGFGRAEGRLRAVALARQCEFAPEVARASLRKSTWDDSPWVQRALLRLAVGCFADEEAQRAQARLSKLEHQLR